MDYGTSGRLWDALILSPMYEDTLNTRLSLPYYEYIIINQVCQVGVLGKLPLT